MLAELGIYPVTYSPVHYQLSFWAWQAKYDGQVYTYMEWTRVELRIIIMFNQNFKTIILPDKSLAIGTFGTFGMGGAFLPSPVVTSPGK